MITDLFVGRSQELQELQAIFNQATLKRGQIIFLEGEAGIGKSLFLDQFKKRQTSIDTSAMFLNGYCHDEISPNNAYQPFLEVFQDLSRLGHKKENSQLWHKVLKETAPNWLEAIPVVGQLLSATAKTISVTNDLLLTEQDKSYKSDNMISQYIDGFSKLSTKGSLLVITIEDAHWIDNSSCQLLQAFSEILTNKSILIIVTYRPHEISHNDALKKTKDYILSNKKGKIIKLKGFTKSEIKQYINKRYKSNLSENISEWFIHLCKGHPLFISQYCNLLEQEKIIRQSNNKYILDGSIIKSDGNFISQGTLSSLPIPNSIEVLLERRINKLLDEEKLLLELASVQGELFDSSILASISEYSNEKEAKILTRLRKVSERHRIIHLLKDDFSKSNYSEHYEFEHMLMHEAFYKKLSPKERKIYHFEIAKILENRINYEEKNRKIIIEISHHYLMAEDFLMSSRYSYSAAISLFNDGAIIECLNLCEQIIENLQIIPSDNGDRDSLFAKVTLLLMNSTKPRSREEKLKILAFGNQGILAAKNTDDKISLSGIQTHICSLYIGLGNVNEALKYGREAFETGKASGNLIAVLNAVALYGREMSKVNPKKGLTVRRESYQLYKKRNISSEKLQKPYIIFTISKLLISLGVGEFDGGYYSNALKYLQEGIERIKDLNFKKIANYTSALNYLAQVLIAIGLFEKAEEILKEAINIVDSEPDPWHGNNLGLLGKLYIEWDQLELASQYLLKGLEESEITQQTDLITIVRNYYGELLIHPKYSKANLQEAENLLLTNLGECQLSNMHRSTIVTLSLLSRLASAKKNFADAISYGNQAIEMFKKYGHLPAVRVEEIYFYQYITVSKANRLEDSFKYLEVANNIIEEKAKSITEHEYRLSYYSNIKLNKDITTHYNALKVIYKD